VKGVLKDFLKKSRVVTGLLTEHNTLKRHFYVMGLILSPLSRRCGKPQPMFFVSDKPWLHTDTPIRVNFFLNTEDFRSVSLGIIW